MISRLTPRELISSLELVSITCRCHQDAKTVQFVAQIALVRKLKDVSRNKRIVRGNKVYKVENTLASLRDLFNGLPFLLRS